MHNPRLQDKHLLAGHYAIELTWNLNGAKCGSGLRSNNHVSVFFFLKKYFKLLCTNIASGINQSIAFDI